MKLPERLRLRDVTLVMVETREHALANLAVEDCVKAVEFDDVLVFTDRQLEFSSLTHVCDPRFITVPDWPDKYGWCRANWFLVPPHVRTSHILFVQWDACIWHPEMWRDDFKQYDYIGAPWTWHKTRRVGNSGFSLKSSRLARYIRDRSDKFPCTTEIEDDLICRTYRWMLEDAGFVWAPETVARDFAYEGAGGEKCDKAFGFHGAFNFNLLGYERTVQRAKLMMESPTLREGLNMKVFCQRNPEIIKELLEGGTTPKEKISWQT